jgi:hypothetical protein
MRAERPRGRGALRAECCRTNLRPSVPNESERGLGPALANLPGHGRAPCTNWRSPMPNEPDGPAARRIAARPPTSSAERTRVHPSSRQQIRPRPRPAPRVPRIRRSRMDPLNRCRANPGLGGTPHRRPAPTSHQTNPNLTPSEQPTAGKTMPTPALPGARRIPRVAWTR